LVRFDPESPEVNWLALSESTTPALPDNSVWQIREDLAGHIYLFTDKGIVRLTPHTPSVQDPSEYGLYTFTTADGLPSNGCNQGASMIDTEGRLWVGTGAGAAVFDPRAYTGDHTAKPLYVEQVLINGKKVPFRESASLPYHENNLRFEYALLNFFREGATAYRFQLMGFDPEPSDWTGESNKEYTNLGEGNYVFRVWARDYAGNVSGPTAVNFRILAAPWRTWTAYSLYSFLLIAGVAATDRFQRSRLIRKERERAHLREAELRAETAEAQAKAIEAENRRKSEELNFARQLQLSMLPKHDVLLDRVDIVGRMRTATEVGGDYYDFIKIDDNRYCIAIGDATGHGVGAGLVVGMVKTALLNSVLRWNPESGVRELMIDLNATLKASLTHRGVGMCFSVAVIDVRTMTVDVCSSGMPFPCRYDAASGAVAALPMPGPPIGFMRQISPRTEKVHLGQADRLVLMSDGFHERRNEDGQCWGYETVAGELARICSEESAAAGIAERMFLACDQFARQHEPEDDLTIVVMAAKSQGKPGP
jgi:serine phosphatase RsbU (regulator of sigma subunit)